VVLEPGPPAQAYAASKGVALVVERPRQNIGRRSNCRARGGKAPRFRWIIANAGRIDGGCEPPHARPDRRWTARAESQQERVSTFRRRRSNKPRVGMTSMFARCGFCENALRIDILEIGHCVEAGVHGTKA